MPATTPGRIIWLLQQTDGQEAARPSLLQESCLVGEESLPKSDSEENRVCVSQY